MATRAINQRRLNFAYQALLSNRPSHRIVAELAEGEGVSRRQARRIVGAAAEELVHDLDHLERPAMLARFVVTLEATIEKSLESGQLAVTVGAVRTLADLLQFPRPSTASTERPQYTGRRGGYG